MRTICDILGTRPVEGTFGVEIELEGRDFPRSALGNWRAEHDPSLRGEENVEYVIKTPVNIDGVKKDLKTLSSKLAASGARIDTTTRAGIHIHVNVGDMTTVELFNFICTFFILERSLLNLCAKHRIGNHFCLRSSDAEYLVKLIEDSVRTENLGVLKTEDIRYSAMNLNSLFKYGSLEFRFMESEGDFDKILFWCNIFNSMKTFAKESKNPREILSSVSMNGYENFCFSVLGEATVKIKDQPTFNKDIRSGLLTAQDIAYSHSWKNTSLNIFKVNKNMF